MTAIEEIEIIELYSESKEIGDLVRGFKSHELPKEKWTHEAHLTVALWHLLHYPSDEATERMREGIQSYNSSKGVITTKTSGYHEVISKLKLQW